jgi:sentrin-specific protease 1
MLSQLEDDKVLSQLEDYVISLSLRNVKMTEEDVIHLSGVLSGTITQPDTILIDKFQIDMTVAKISCLKPGTWLNDEVINFYSSMLMQDLAQSTKSREIYIFSTFFMSKLNQSGVYSFELVARWTKKIDIFGLKKVFIPINIRNQHWTLVFIDLTVKTIGYYDAMAGNESSYMNLTLKVLPSPWRSLFYLYQLIITLSYRNSCSG